MSSPKRKRFALRPTVTESRLEQRLVLASRTGTTAAAPTTPTVYVLGPLTEMAPAGVTPASAPSPISAPAAARASHPLKLARLRKDYAKQVRLAARDLRSAIQTRIGRLYASGATPTAQQLADSNASINTGTKTGVGSGTTTTTGVGSGTATGTGGGIV